MNRTSKKGAAKWLKKTMEKLIRLMFAADAK